MSPEIIATAGPDAAAAKSRSALITIYDVVGLGARTIHAVLTAAGYPCDLILFRDKREMGVRPTDLEYRLLGDLLRELRPAVIGVSLRSFAVDIAERITAVAREAGVPLVIWGGTHPTLDPESCLETADAVVVGEGEGAMLDIVEALAAGRPIAGIQNVCTRGEGGIVRNPLRPLIQDLDALPFPVLGDAGKYTIDRDVLMPRDVCLGTTPPRSYFVVASRGCPFNCDFCCNSALRRIYSGLGTYVRKRSPENVIRELALAREALPLKFVSFMDELFTLDREWNREICALYKEKIRLPFWAEIHPTTIDDDMMKTMQDAGLSLVMMGVQSGSDRSRRENYHRTTAREDIIRAAHLLHKYRQVAYYDFIVDNPYETREDLRETLEMILDLPRPHNLEVFSLCWFPSTKITERALADGKITPDQLEDQTHKTFDHFLADALRSINRDNEFAITLTWLEQLKVSWSDLTMKFWQDEFEGTRHVLPRALFRVMLRSDYLWAHPGLVRAVINPLVRPIGWGLAVLRPLRSAWRLARDGQWSDFSRRAKGRLRGKNQKA